MERYSLEVNDVVLEAVNQNKASSELYVRLINGVSAKFESGKISVVMGASGSSKTTLISLIAGHVDANAKTCGSILFKGQPRDPKAWLSQIAYLEQDDFIVPQQTVKEYIYFSVRCRMSKKQLAGKSVNGVVEDAMKKLHIDGLRDTKLVAISGGERKRVMIAVEFAVGSDVLILDEATSGLDSHLALELVHLVKAYAVENNKIVIMIVHQPGCGLFEMFDYLLFLNRGSVIYSGPVGECDNFLSSKGISRNGNLSKSEFLFELFSKDSVIPEIKEHKSAINEIAEAAFEEGQQKVRGKTLRIGNDFAVDFSFNFRNFFLIVKRQMVHDWRTWGMLKRWPIEIFFLWVLIAKIGLRVFATSAINRLSTGYFNSFEKTYEYLRRKVGDDLYTNLAEAVKWGQYPFLLFFSSISASTLLDDESYISRETSKGTYNLVTLYVSLLAAEYLFTVIRCGIFFGVLSSCGFEGGMTPMLLTYVFMGSFMAVMFNTLTKCITSSMLLRRILMFASSFFTTMGRPEALRFLISLAKALKYDYLVHLRYILVFWPHVFFETIMTITLAKKILFSSSRSFITQYLNIIVSAMHSDAKINEEGYMNDIKYYVTASEPAAYSNYWLFVILGGSLLLVVSTSIYLLIARFSPRLRMKLSD